MRSLCLLILPLALAATAAAAPAKTKVFITSTAKTDKPAKKGEAGSQAQASARAMENLIAQGMDGRFPCSSSMTPTDVGDLLGHERTRQLLGSGGDPATLTVIADSMNAPYLVHIGVTDYGAKRTVNISLINAKKAMATARYSKTIPIDSDAYEALEGMVEEFLNSLGEAFPKCRGNVWKGAFTVTQQSKEHGVTPGGGTWNAESNFSMKCTTQASVGDADCSVSYAASLSGKGVEKTDEAGGSVGGYATVDVSPGNVDLYIRGIGIKGTMKSTFGGGEMNFRFGPWHVIAPSSGNEDSTSGSWSNDSGTTITWSFSRQ